MSKTKEVMIMKSKFLDDLKLSLKSSGVKDVAANEITRVYDEYFLEAERLGKTYDETRGSIENLNSIVSTFAPKKVREYKEVGDTVIKEKRSLGVIALYAVLFFFLNIFLVPALIAMFGGIVCIALLPLTFILAALGVLLYGNAYVNGHLIMMNPLTRWTLPIGVIGLSILCFVLAFFLLKWLFKLVALIFSWQAKFLRRYK